MNMKFEITRNPADFAPFLYVGKAYKHSVPSHSVYDFTFEGRYIVYHSTHPSMGRCEYVYQIIERNERSHIL